MVPSKRGWPFNSHPRFNQVEFCRQFFPGVGDDLKCLVSKYFDTFFRIRSARDGLRKKIIGNKFFKNKQILYKDFKLDPYMIFFYVNFSKCFWQLLIPLRLIQSAWA